MLITFAKLPSTLNESAMIFILGPIVSASPICDAAVRIDPNSGPILSLTTLIVSFMLSDIAFNCSGLAPVSDPNMPFDLSAATVCGSG